MKLILYLHPQRTLDLEYDYGDEILILIARSIVLYRSETEPNLYYTDQRPSLIFVLV